MTFLTFLLYYTGAVILHQIFQVVFIFAYSRYQQNKFMKMVKDKKIQIMTMDDLMDQLQQQDEDKKWN